MDDASLDAFIGEPTDDSEGPADGGSDPDDADGADDADGGATESTDAAAAEPTAVDSTPSTYAWDPAGVACADCGAVVERRWRDGDRLVCTECKAW